jgi:hypothetical protein
MSAVKVRSCPTAAFNGIYCQSTLEYFQGGSFQAGGTRYSYVHRGDANKKIFFENYGDGKWIIADSYDGFNEEKFMRGDDIAVPQGTWDDNTTETITGVDCSSSSSSSSSCSSSSCSCSSSSSSLNNTSVDAYHASGFATGLGFNGTYCAAGLKYYQNGAWVSGGTRYYYENENDDTSVLFFENYGSGSWVIAKVTYNGSDEVAYIANSGATPPTGAWGAFCNITTAVCGSSSSSSSCSCSSSSCSCSSSCSSWVSSSSSDVW